MSTTSDYSLFVPVDTGFQVSFATSTQVCKKYTAFELKEGSLSLPRRHAVLGLDEQGHVSNRNVNLTSRSLIILVQSLKQSIILGFISLKYRGGELSHV